MGEVVITVYSEGEEIETQICDEAHAALIERNYERQGYEVRITEGSDD